MQYPEAVAKIVSNYMERMKAQMRMAPAAQQVELLREIESHIYEAYMQTPGDDEIGRILAVLGKLGEPAEVVSDRLPGAMVSSGAKKSLPLYILGGIFIALFGIPLGFGGFGVLLGLLAALAGVTFAYFAVAGTISVVGALFMLLGVVRMVMPEAWDRLVTLGFIGLEGVPGEFFQHLSISDQGLLLMLIGCVFGGCGWGMFLLGKRFLRGLRFLSSLVFDWMRRTSQSFRQRLRRNKAEIYPEPGFPVTPGAGTTR